MARKAKDYNYRFVKRSENDFPVTIKMEHYQLEQNYIGPEADNSVLEEWGYTPEIEKLELKSEPKPNEETGMYEYCPPISLSINDQYIKKYDIPDIVKEFHKEYSFREIESKFVLYDRSTGNMIVAEIVGSLSVDDRFSYLYRDMRKNIFIPMMAQALFNITREFSRTTFYDLNGYYTAGVVIKEKVNKFLLKQQEQYG